MSTSEDRLTVLEEKLAFQDDTLQKLDDALASQQQQLMNLSRKTDLLLDQLKKLEAMWDSADPQDEKPPHY